MSDKIDILKLLTLAPLEAKNTSSSQRGRSISVSSELECRTSGVPNDETTSDALNHKSDERNRTVSACVYSSSTKRRDLLFRAINFDTYPRLSEQDLLQLKDNLFPFHVLPKPCKEKVFSYLNPFELGKCAQVCHDWLDYVKSPLLWKNVDLGMFPACTRRKVVATHECNGHCYDLYKRRVKKFVEFLVGIKPIVKTLTFGFDIADYEDGWLETVNSLIRAARLDELQSARLDWKETDSKPFCGSSSFTVAGGDYQELMHRQRHRQRLFVNFFEKFTIFAPNVERLQLPFDWSPRAIQLLGRFGCLDTLILEKYSIFQPLTQSCLDSLAQVCASLKRLIFEIWTPSGRGMQLYSLQSQSLVFIDISQCRGLYFSSLLLPQLEVIKVSPRPWSGPLVSRDNIQIPCILSVLANGTSKIKQLNDHALEDGWKIGLISVEFENFLQTACPCPSHKTIKSSTN